ncbi:uncharacterized protein LOC133876347 [Alnus glutinosa]|jgi:hypothetical protein|uniref:uncharacterized protein LOC133876347 n=1 Tax=Alnus glutinosa TaxID=3517 RepID=UPI002D789EA1|nr:uncharacterized protein LOC133876347 [Alnus glutinosa]
MDEVEQKPPKMNLKQMNPKINIPEINLDDLKKQPHLHVSPSLKETKGKQSARWKNCLCSPTTHVGSFRCRHHRSSSLHRGGSVGSKLSELAHKSGTVSDSLQAQ